MFKYVCFTGYAGLTQSSEVSVLQPHPSLDTQQKGQATI